jgi:amino acid adenylation domain-containing protein
MSEDLLRELHELGVRLRLSDGRLEVRAPRGKLTPALLEELRVQRDGLIDLLRQVAAGEERIEVTPDPHTRHEPFPLTDIQYAYWVGRNPAVDMGGVATHFYGELESSGLDLDRLNESLRKLIDRHDMLRAVVDPDGRQRILREVPPYQISVNDLRGLSPDARNAEIDGLRAEMGPQVLPADTWPLFDIRASRLDGGLLRLHVSFDMLMIDGYSVGLIFRDWQRFYEDPGWAPEPLDLSFRDYVLAEVSLRQGGRYRNAREYWLKRLDDLPPAPELPQAAQPPRRARTEFTRRHDRVPRERWDVIKRIARERGLTPPVVLLTAFTDVLRRWSRQADFTLNLTLFNRPPLHPQVDAVVGDFTSLTLLAVEDAAGLTFAARAKQRHLQLLRDLQHQSYSGVQVMRERARRLGGRPGASMPVVFTSMLGVDPKHGHALDTAFFGEMVHGVSQTPQVWLDHQITERQGDLVLNWDSAEAIFPPGLLDDMFGAYLGLIDRLSRDETAWDEEALPALPPRQTEERDGANDTAAAIPERTLCDLVETQVARNPGAPAIITADGTCTYGELASGARRLARRLRSLGAATDTLIGVVADKGREQVAGVLGVALSGAAYLPIDPQWPEARRRELLEQGRVRLVVTTGALRDELGWPEDVRLVTADDAAVRAASDRPLDTGPAPRDLAYVIFTSGSTGKPKGVMIDHRGAANTVQDINQRFGVGPDDRVLALSALSFDLSVYDIFGVLAAGGAVVMPSPGRAHDPAHWTDLVTDHGVTLWNSVPALMQAWVDAKRPPAPKLRLVLLSGDWIPVTLPDQIRLGCPQAQVISLGGATEASIWSVFHPIGDVPPEWTRIPYGKPLANQTLHVYDAALQPCPEWTTGEIYIGGVGVALGYWADPERTAERFIVHPVTSERLYRTGDLGRYLPGGDIDFLGREDDQVKVNGYRIELGEITAALSRLPEVGEALVTVQHDPRTGSRRLVAHVVPARDRDLHEDPGEPESWRALLAAGAKALREGTADQAGDLRRYQEIQRATEDLCPLIMARTLALLGEFTAAGSTATAGRIVERCGVNHRHRGLVGQWLSVLAETGHLEPAGADGEYRCPRALDAASLDDRIRRGLAVLDDAGADHKRYVVSHADHQVELLRGEVSPVQLLLADGSGEFTEAVYSSNTVMRLQSRALARLVQEFAGRLPDGRPVRILEVGAGTGLTTSHVLPVLAPERARYRFTDISTFFTERAKRRFEHHPFVSYGVFDIDRDPAAQGVPPGSFDVVIAANVMHDAKDLRGSLERLRSVLAPGGVLLLLEYTVNLRLLMISAGFMDGFSNYEGQRDLPLLSADEWRRELTAAGFHRAGSIPDTAVDGLDHHVLVAQAPGGGPAHVDSAELRTALERLLPEYMVPHHFVTLDRLPLSANGKVDHSALPAPWEEAAVRQAVAPRDELEQRLHAIWSEALGHADFGVEDGFFDMGGDSLHAVRILGRLREEFGVTDNAEEGMGRLLNNPTIAKLAGTLRSRPAD